MWYTGIDQHREFCVLTTYGPDGPRVKQARVPSTALALAPYFVQRLLWIPGLGKVNAFTIYTEIDGIARFPSAGQFLSYSRLVPGADNSGGRTRHRSGSKAGNRYLKLAFSHAGIRAVQYNPEIRAFLKAKARRKPIRIARTLVALELARIVYEVLTKQEDFNGKFKNQPLSHRKHATWPRRASPPA